MYLAVIFSALFTENSVFWLQVLDTLVS